MTDDHEGQAPGIQLIRAEEWQPSAARLKHVFLTGDLKIPVSHPFLKRTDVEVIACVYEQGDHGLPHWHQIVDELEFVIEGVVKYLEIASGEILQFEPGDFLHIPHGVCVQRLIDVPARTLAIKLPSNSEKIHCRQCRRECSRRLETCELS